MKNIIIILSSLIFLLAGRCSVHAIYYGDVGPPGPNEFHLSAIGIGMPVGKILLIRKGSEYCAVKFTKFWTENNEDVFYAEYESYQNDDSGNFKRSLRIKKGALSLPEPIGIGRLAFSKRNIDIRCGSFKLLWAKMGNVLFYSLEQLEEQGEGDYGIELAPTIWTEISQVNVFDQRLKWFRYDAKRKRKNISIEKLWEKKKP